MNPEEQDPRDPGRGGPAEPSSDGEAGEASSNSVGPGETDSPPEDTSFYDDPYHDESDHLYDDPHADPPGTGDAADDSGPSRSDPAGAGWRYTASPASQRR